MSLCTPEPIVRIQNKLENVTGKAILSTQNTAKLFIGRGSVPDPTAYSAPQTLLASDLTNPVLNYPPLPDIYPPTPLRPPTEASGCSSRVQ